MTNKVEWENEDFEKMSRALGMDIKPYAYGKASLAEGIIKDDDGNVKTILIEVHKSKLKRPRGSHPHYFLSVSRAKPVRDPELYVAYLPEEDCFFRIGTHDLRMLGLHMDKGKKRYVFNLTLDELGRGCVLYGKNTPEGSDVNVDDCIIWMEQIEDEE